MNKIWLAPLALVALLLISLSSKESFNKEQFSNDSFKVNPSNTKVSWTAYKTSLKIPVTGIFEELIIENQKEASTAVEAVNGLKFKIPVSSLNSLSKLRDGKILKSFFGVMLNTINLTGRIELNEGNKGRVFLKMNGVSKTIPVSYSQTNNELTIEGTMDVNNWGAQAALESLNDACEDLHTGPDGESITWNEVKINVVVSF